MLGNLTYYLNSEMFSSTSKSISQINFNKKLLKIQRRTGKSSKKWQEPNANSPLLIL